MFRLFGCLVVQLFGCSAVQLLGRSAESVGRPRDGSTSPVLSGIGFRLAFRTSFPGLFRDLLFRSQDSSVQFLPQQLPAAGV